MTFFAAANLVGEMRGPTLPGSRKKGDSREMTQQKNWPVGVLYGQAKGTTVTGVNSQ